MFFFCIKYLEVSIIFPDRGEVYTWGWKECVPTGRVVSDQSSAGTSERDIDQGLCSYR